jgi:signal transduction histidine kinase
VAYVPLIWRRRWPLLVLILTCLASTALWILVPTFVASLGVWLALFAVAARCSRRTAIAGLGVSSITIGLNVAMEIQLAHPGWEGSTFLVSGLIGTMINLAVFGVGRWVMWRIVQRQKAARFAAAEAVSEERGRIACVLHDIVAHSVTLMVLQAAGAERLLREDPARAQEALRHVDDLGQQVIVELRRMLGLLVQDAQPHGEPAAQRRWEDIANLISGTRETGRDVRFAVEGHAAPLDPGVELSAYRIVQEALTNASKYADPRKPIEVMVRWGASRVTIRIINHVSDDHKPVSDALSTGHGVLGMRERTRAVAGRFEAGTIEDGRYAVTAGLPFLGSLLCGQPRRR